MQNAISYHLEPGYIYVSGNGGVVRTILGSCVAVCLWEEGTGVGGMNHYLYPHAPGSQAATARYGDVSTAKLIRMMVDMGASRKKLKGQIYGGGSPMGFSRGAVGEENVQVARRELARLGIPVVTEDTGGSMGRKILFDMSTGQTAVLKVHRLRREDWIES